MTNTSENTAGNSNETPKALNQNEAKPGSQQNQGQGKQGNEKPAQQK